MKPNTIKLPLRRIFRETAIYGVPVLLLFIIFLANISLEGSQQFAELAKAFLHGQTNFLNPIGGAGQDPVYYHGKIYWDDGPLPAIVLMPFVALFSIFHVLFYQGYLGWVFFVGILFFVFKLARKLAYSKEDSFLLMYAFVIGSVFIGVAGVSSSWLFAQVLTTFLLFWSLYEYFTRKRWWLIGLICGFLLMTRATAAPILLFFLLELWHDVHVNRHDLKYYVQLFLPVIGAGLLLALYNVVRFHSPFNNGSEYQLLEPESAQARSLGVFSLSHIPTNFYSAFLRGPVPLIKYSTSWTLKFPYIQNNPYGMSIFMTSPYLLYLFTQKWSSYKLRERHLIIATLVSCFVVLAYFGIGLDQYGYRYSLDFLPEAFLLFMIMYKKDHERLSRGMKYLILFAGIVNFWLVWSFIGS